MKAWTALKNHRSLAVYKRLLKFLRPYRKQFFIALGAMTAYGATDGIVPLLLRSVLDDVLGAGDETLLYLIPLAIVLFAMLRAGLGFAQHYLAASVGLFVVKDVRNAIHRHLLRLSPQYFSFRSSGALISRMTNDTLLIRSALTDGAAAVLRDSIRVIALMSVALYLDPFLALLSFVGLPVCLLPMIKFGKRVRKLSRVGQDQFGGLTSILQESISGHRVVQAFNLEENEQRKFRKENESFTNTFRKAERYGALSAPANEVIASIAIAGVVLYGGVSVISASKTQGDFIAFLVAMFLLYEPIKKLSRVNNIIQTGVAAAERIFEVLDTVPDVCEAPGAKDLKSGPASIQLQEVSFRYQKSEHEESEEWALRGVSLEINAGDTVALVGMSGGGKSTLVKLLPRFYDPQEGRIFINGQDLKSLTLHSLRDAIAVVDQHPFLFNDSAYNNILFGKLDATPEEVKAAALAANAHEFIEKLPDGYQTVIGEQGFTLSGGQRARLAIARALLKNARILVLDEATAALDSESEQLVQTAIDRLLVGRTVLVIAHRLATVRQADKIVVIRDGKIVEQGTHHGLLSEGGEYAKLHSIQFVDREAAKAVHQGQ